METVARGSREPGCRHVFVGSRPRQWEDMFVSAYEEYWMITLGYMQPMIMKPAQDKSLKRITPLSKVKMSRRCEK